MEENEISPEVGIYVVEVRDEKGEWWPVSTHEATSEDEAIAIYLADAPAEASDVPMERYRANQKK